MELTRKQVIEELKAILEMQYWNVPLSKTALEYAISSLKTDEAYQIMYEGGEIFTKDEVIVIFKELKQNILDQSWCLGGYVEDIKLTKSVVYVSDIDKVFQKKINALKGDKNDSND